MPKPEHHQYDKPIKEAFRYDLQMFLKLFGIDETQNPKPITPKIQKTQENEADLLIEITENNRKIVYHVEVESSNKYDITSRLLLYAGLIYTGIPDVKEVVQILLYLPDDNASRVELSRKDMEASNGFRYKVIHLAKDIPYNYFVENAKNVHGLVWAILANLGADPDQALEEIVKSALTIDDGKKLNTFFIQAGQIINLRKKYQENLINAVQTQIKPKDMDAITKQALGNIFRKPIEKELREAITQELTQQVTKEVTQQTQAKIISAILNLYKRGLDKQNILEIMQVSEQEYQLAMTQINQ